MKKYNVAVVGVGAVGEEMLRVLRQRNFPVNTLKVFARSARELHAHLLTVAGADRQTLWLIWPKKASKVASDLDGNVVRETGLRSGWVDFKVCAVEPFRVFDNGPVAPFPDVVEYGAHRSLDG